MPTFTKPTDEQLAALRHTIATWHKPLAKAKVTIDLVVAWGKVNTDGEIIGPAIKHHGVPAMGLCKINGLQARVLGHADATITIDGDRWKQLSERRQYALLSHELQHLGLVTEAQAKVKTPKVGDPPQIVAAKVELVPKLDDHGRPKLRIIPHDHEFGWFNVVVENHGRDSFEAAQAQRFADEFGQLYLWDTPGRTSAVR